jgi:hypothetical protein
LLSTIFGPADGDDEEVDEASQMSATEVDVGKSFAG